MIPNQETSASARLDRIMGMIRGELEEQHRDSPPAEVTDAPLQPNTLPELRLPRPAARRRLVGREDGSLHVYDFVALDDGPFLDAAFVELLGRGPDPESHAFFAHALATGTMSRIDVLGHLWRSSEGKGRGARVRGLASRFFISRLERRLPPVGFALRWLLDLFALPRRLAALRGENDRLRRRLDLLHDTVDQLASTLEPAFNRAVDSLNQRAGQRALALLDERLTEVLYQKAERSEIDRLRLELGALDEMGRRLGELERETGARPGTFLADLRRRVDRSFERSLAVERRLDAGGAPPAGGERNPAEPAGSGLPDSLRVELLDYLRGDPGEVGERLRVHLDRVARLDADGRTVLDVGCGRGEWLQILLEAGVAAEGVERNPLLVERCTESGLEVSAGDLFEFLAGQPDAHHAAVTAFHVVERLPRERLVEFLDECRRVLVPGGLLLVETPNVGNVKVGASDFHLDPGHRTPLHPALLSFLFEARGFRNVELDFLHAEPSEDDLGRDGVARAVGELLFGARDYSVVGHKA